VLVPFCFGFYWLVIFAKFHISVSVYPGVFILCAER
jgi:hypothetical protein